MGLKAFHVAFIFIANLLCLGMGIWFLNEAGETGNLTYSILGAISITGLVGLLIYSAWFLKKCKSLSYFAWLLAVAAVSAPSPAWACAVCQGDSTNPMIIGAKVGVLFLMAVIVTVLAGLGGIFLVWRRREKALTA